VTHLYTLLLGGTVITGRDEPDASAIAWAADTVIAIGTDDEVRRTSRGDSRVIDLGGAVVLPLDETGGARWPPAATLEVGGRADLVLLEHDPRRAVVPAGRRLSTIALVRGGVVVAGHLPGAEAEPGHDH
jgi:predicted amidohydrolase YtcJ